MDEKLIELMPCERGIFVEAGAHDGYTQSNTYFLERYRGWSGVLVEPIPELRKQCEQRRTRSQVVGCALVGPSFPTSTAEVEFGDRMSVVGDSSHARRGLAVTGRKPYTVTVPARTLSDVLDGAGVKRIDLMILDVEGHELDVLSGLDLTRHAPTYLLVEALNRAVQQPSLDSALNGSYDFVEALSDYDLLYRRRESTMEHVGPDWS